MTTFRRPGRLELLYIGPAFSHAGVPLPLTHAETIRLLRDLGRDIRGRAGLWGVYASAFGRTVNSWDNDGVVFDELARLLTTGELQVWSVPVPGSPLGTVWPPAPLEESQAEETQAPKKKAWVEILVLDDGTPPQPVAGDHYRIELPDGTLLEGKVNAKGKARIEDIDPGQCKVSFPDLDSAAWSAA